MLFQGTRLGDGAVARRTGKAVGQPRLLVGRPPRRGSLAAVRRGVRGSHGTDHPRVPPFPRSLRVEPEEFHARLGRFLGELPSGFEYAVELRDARLLTPAYRDLLARHNVAHTFNYWSAMPSPGDQTLVVPPEESGFGVVRLLLRPGTWYEDQRERFKPFDSTGRSGRGYAGRRRCDRAAHRQSRPSRVRSREQQG
jgi:hypothetical protein